MKEATLIYPHQLFKSHPALALGRSVYLVEEPLFMSEFPIHRQKLLLHRLSMQSYYRELTEAGYAVTYLEIADTPTTDTVFKYLKKAGVTKVHYVDVTDMWLYKRMVKAATECGLELQWYESPLFILPKEESVARYRASKKHMARFYQKLRQDKNILLTKEGEPVGGEWSFDSENRKKLPKNYAVPSDPVWIENDEVKAALTWLLKVPGEQYGEARQWLPYTRAMAQAWCKDFLQERFAQFGDFEDALSTDHVRLFHSVLSPLINIGLLTPSEVLEQAITYAEKNGVPINSLEGFVRQILGWREFIRAAYESDGVAMRTKNFWQHTRALPASWWTGDTGIVPVDASIKTALKYGYNHHIERLMVLGNVMLLSQIHPDHVYRWFMAMYVDAYDWVMVPNVYGMSQFADGGIFATKPYISGSNYIKKMSNFQSGEWEDTWTALYWHFIGTHQTFFLNNHRLSMMPRLLSRMAPEKKAHFQKLAGAYFKQ